MVRTKVRSNRDVSCVLLLKLHAFMKWSWPRQPEDQQQESMSKGERQQGGGMCDFLKVRVSRDGTIGELLRSPLQR